MSRSFKKTPYAGDRKTPGKKIANRKVRRLLNRNLDLAKGSSYKKLYEQWDICDFYSKCTWGEYLASYRYNKEDGFYYDVNWNWHISGKYTKEELYEEWYKSFKRK